MMEKKNSVMPTVAGVLLIVSAGFKLLIFIMALAAGLFIAVPSSFPRIDVIGVLFLLVPLAAIEALTLAGGIFSLQRRRWGLALAGAIVAILPFSLLGIASTVLIAISRDEFTEA